METTSIWPIALEVLRALGAQYGPAMDQAATELGLPSPEWYGWLLPALLFDPDPISATRLRMRVPYTAPRLYDDHLSGAAAQGYLKPVSGTENEYRLSESGRKAADGVISAAYARMETLHPLPQPDLDQLADLLYRVVKSCLAAPGPPGKWSLMHSRRIDSGAAAPVMVRIDQYLSDLGAYRDDAHLAAWQPYQIEGHAWEAFTFLWRGEATTLNNLYQKLERRGFSAEVYQHALDDLEQRGWIEQEAGKFQLTTTGKETRQAAEDATEQYFYSPWDCLQQNEKEALHTLLTQLRKNLLSLVVKSLDTRPIFS